MILLILSVGPRDATYREPEVSLQGTAYQHAWKAGTMAASVI